MCYDDDDDDDDSLCLKTVTVKAKIKNVSIYIYMYIKITKVHDTQNKNLHIKTVYTHFSPHPPQKTIYNKAH